MAKKKQIALSCLFQANGYHKGAWRTPEAEPGERAAGTAPRRSGDPVGDYIRSIQALDGEVGAYEARQSERRRLADDLRRSLDTNPDIAPDSAAADARQRATTPAE